MSEEPKPESSHRSARLLLVALVALGFMARLTLAFVMGDGHAARLPGSAEYLAIGRSVAEGEGFVLRAASAVGPAEVAGRGDAARHMPGYPLILAAAGTMFGMDDRAVLVLQSLCGAATLIVVIAMAARLAGLWAAVVAVALLTFDPYQVYFSSQLVPVVPVGLALVAVTAAGMKFLERVSDGGRRGWLWAALAGLALAVATYLEAWAAGFVLAAGLAAVASKQRKRLLAGWAVAVVVLVVALAPWLARNAVQAGAPVLTTDIGLRLYEGTGRAGGPCESPCRRKGLTRPAGVCSILGAPPGASPGRRPRGSGEPPFASYGCGRPGRSRGSVTGCSIRWPATRACCRLRRWRCWVCGCFVGGRLPCGCFWRPFT